MSERGGTTTASAGGSAGWGFDLPPRWQLERQLAVGGQAEVWLARDTQLGERVAVKIFHPAVHPDSFERLRREVRLGRRLQHPNLVRVYELIEAGDRLALAMEWLADGSVADKLEREGPARVDEVVRLAEQVLAALEHLHGQGIVHRDVKPSNLLLAADGQVKLGDLGLIKTLRGDERLTVTATTVGSPGYMSPEQIRGQELSPASDLYSLGATLYKLLTGQRPFEADSDFELAHRHVEDLPADPRRLRADCPPWLALFVMRLLEKRPGDRWPDAGEALAALRSQSATRSPRFWRRVGRLALIGGASAAAAVLVVLGVLRAAHAGAAAEVTFEGSRLVGLGSHGRRLWAFDCGAPVQAVQQVSLFGDGTRQVLATAYPKTATFERGGSQLPSEVVILDLDGRLVSEFRPESAALQIDTYPIAPPVLVPQARAFDLIGDGRKEVVVNCHHRLLGTAYLFVFWPASRRWEAVLAHPGGWLFHVEGVPGAAQPTIRFLGFNGLDASSPVIAQLTVRPPGGGRLELSDANPIGLPGALVPRQSAFSWYTLLEQAQPGAFDSDPGFVMRPDGSSLFAVFGRRCTVDRWGNPSTGPNGGRDLAALRLAVLASVGPHSNPSRGRPLADVIAEEKRILAQAGPLLAERPYRAVLALYDARARANAGDATGAVRLLEETWADTGNDALGLNLGHLQAIAGDLTGAVATLERNRADAVTPAGSFRTPQLLARVAIEAHDRRTFEDAIATWPAVEPSGPQAALRARADLWWDTVHDEDTQVRSFDTVPDGEAVACLARWRLGRTQPGDPQAMKAAEARDPDAAPECQLARAAALMALGQGSEAVRLTTDVVTYLAPRSPCDFMLFQLLELARALQAKALLAAGRPTDAHRAAAALRPTLHAGLLPAILADEVLRESRTSPPRRSARLHGRDETLERPVRVLAH